MLLLENLLREKLSKHAHTLDENLTLNSALNMDTIMIESSALVFSGSGAGTAIMPFKGTSYKKVIINISTELSNGETMKLIYPLEFTNTPIISSTNLKNFSGITNESRSIEIEVGGPSGTGWVIIEGF